MSVFWIVLKYCTGAVACDREAVPLQMAFIYAVYQFRGGVAVLGIKISFESVCLLVHSIAFSTTCCGNCRSNLVLFDAMIHAN